jgi:hypothetical protein
MEKKNQSEKVERVSLPDNLYDEAQPIMRSYGSRTFDNFSRNTTVKSSFTKSDYDYFRHGGNFGSRQSILKLCQEAYEKVGIIQNVVNLMADFGSKGIRIRHTDPELDKFCQKWSEKVNVTERSERFLNCLYRQGAVVIYRKFGRASNSITSKYIPIQYIYLHPGSVEVKDEDKGIVPSKFEYLIKYSNNITRNIHMERINSVIPEELKSYQYSLKPIPANRIRVFNYRKDDWDFWGWPITYPLIDDLRLLEKLKLSDSAALDGAVSNIRLWTVGQITDNPATTVIPTSKKLKQIADLISHGVGGGSMDLVLGPEVKFTESSTSVHNFLGEAKYKPTIDSIYDGLGIPSPLRSSNKDNNTGNAISLKTLLERLNYGRNYLIEFWKREILEVFETLGFSTEEEPTIEFDTMVLSDEAAEKKLLLDMVDRDIIDIETVHEKFKVNSPLVKKNLKKEVSERGGELPVKAGPFHNAHIQDTMKQGLLNQGLVTPSEIGLDIDIDESEVQSRFKQKRDSMDKGKFSDTPGRPPNITETKKRKAKPAKAIVWASKAQKEISDMFTPIYLQIVGKKNVRSLSVEETELLEETKAKILLSIEPYTEINEECILKACAKKIDISELKEEWKQTEEELGTLTVDQKRQITSLYYSNFGEENGDHNS